MTGGVLASRTARRRGILFTALLAVTLLLMAFSSNPVLLEVQRGVNFAFRPIQGTLDEIGGGISTTFQALREMDRLRLDNTQLRDENDRLAAENARLAEIRRENELLTGLLQLRNGFEYQTVAAQVIARESSEFRQLVTLSKGTDDAIENGDVVIAQGGALAGRVIEVGPTFAKVLLITDTSSTVIGQLPSAATGEVVGQLNGVLIMGRIDSQERIDLGAEVVTAGIELGGGVRSPFPKGLVIGQIIDVQRDANAIVQTAYLLPAAPLDRLEYVLVITDYEGGLPPVEEQPRPCVPDEGGVLPDGEQPCASPPPSPSPRPASPSPAGSGAGGATP
jgi:rod shape-determining protein MreC